MAKDAVASWTRPHFQPGGGEPFLFYVCFGNFPQELAPSSSRYRLLGIPDGINALRYDESTQPKVLGSFLCGFLWDELRAGEPALAAAVANAPESIVVRGTAANSETLDYLRDAVGFISYLTDSGGVAVYDPQMFRWWAPGEWRKEIFNPASAVPRHHVTILVSEDGNAAGHWYHTRGMRKFGRPDISVRNVTQAHKDGVIDLINRFIEMQAFGAVIPEGHPIRMKSLPEGLTCHHNGDREDTDFNNVHLEIRLPG